MKQLWIQNQFSNADMQDRRLTKRACKIAQACAKHPKASLPDRFENWAGIKAAYRFFSNPKVTHQILQKPHYKNVLNAAKASKNTVLFIQDSSELLFNTHPATHGLGPTADSTGNGLMFHSCLVHKYHDSKQIEILGLGYQEAWVRSEKKVKRNRKGSKESDIWLRTLEKIGKPKREWITVGDRGNDIYEFLDGAKKLGWQFVVRAKHNRKIEIQGVSQWLFPWLRSLGSKCQSIIQTRENGQGFSQELALQITWAQTKVLAPLTKKKFGAIDELTYIRVWCPEQPGLEWILITNLPIENEVDAQKIVDIYRRRWLIEDYHKVLKTGLQIEKNQFKEVGRILALLGMLGVIATQLLAIREQCRLHPQELAVKSVPKIWVGLVEQRMKQNGLKTTIKTTRDFWRCIAQMGGFIGRKSDGEPGWQTIWKGFVKLQDMLLGINLLRDLVGKA